MLTAIDFHKGQKYFNLMRVEKLITDNTIEFRIPLSLCSFFDGILLRVNFTEAPNPYHHKIPI